MRKDLTVGSAGRSFVFEGIHPLSLAITHPVVPALLFASIRLRNPANSEAPCMCRIHHLPSAYQ